MPRGILFWRSLTQWLGGIGIIFISLSVFPLVKSINIQLAATEFAGQMTDKIHPRIREAAKRLIVIYIIITIAESLLLIAGHMPVFDAVCHSLSTVSTGGFSTHNNSFSTFATPYLMVITILFMFLAGTNLTLVYFALNGNFRKVTSNNEFVFYSMLCIGSIFIVSIILFVNNSYSPGNSLLNGAFQVVSVITTTGFYTQNYYLWGNLMIILLLLLMFTGGTAGSTSGSLKIVRLLLIMKNNRQELIRLIHPNAFIPVRLDKQVIAPSTIYNLLIFISLYIIIMCIGTFAMSFMNYDLITSFSTSASMLANIGPGLGSFGPFTDYSSMAVAGKWFSSGLMLLGRLELLTVILLFTRSFYRK
jgi:trk system potassium uptake protein TrkH